MGAVFLVVMAILAVAYFAIRGRAIRFREQLQEALRRAGQRAQSQIPTQDMIKCPICGTYSAPGQQKACDRADCPYR